MPSDAHRLRRATRRAIAGWLAFLVLVAGVCGAVAGPEDASHAAGAIVAEDLVITAPPGGRTHEPEVRAAIGDLARRLKALPEVAEVRMPRMSADRSRARLGVRLAAPETATLQRAVDAVLERHGGSGLLIDLRSAPPER